MVRLKRWNEKDCGMPVDKFQSHYGSIKTWRDQSGEDNMNCFNPTMVRLKPYTLLHTTTPLAGFNPTMVRLKPESFPPLKAQ